VHHFAQPELQVCEMARVCRRGGRVVLLDMISPSVDVRARFDALHREIDPSHASCLLEEELSALLMRCTNAPVKLLRSCGAPLAFEVFEHQSATARPAALERVRGALRRDANGSGEATGFEPLVDANGALHVHLTTAIAIAVRA
jgi:hypothetical protein